MKKYYSTLLALILTACGGTDEKYLEITGNINGPSVFAADGEAVTFRASDRSLCSVMRIDCYDNIRLSTSTSNNRTNILQNGTVIGRVAVISNKAYLQSSHSSGLMTLDAMFAGGS